MLKCGGDESGRGCSAYGSKADISNLISHHAERMKNMNQTDPKHSPGENRKGCKGGRCDCRKGGKQQNPAHVMQEIAQEAHSDVLGSYTGTPADGGQPQQDADDL